MSITIYGGHRVFANNLDEAVKKIKSCKELIKKEESHQRGYRLIERAFKVYEENILTQLNILEKFPHEELKIKKEKWNSRMVALGNDTFSEEISKFSPDDPKMLNELKVIIFPEKFEENKKSYYLCMINGNPDFKKYLVEKEILEEYYYWDNSEEPEELSAEQWNKRGKEWAEALTDKSGNYLEEGMIITILKAQKYEFYLTSEDNNIHEQYFKQFLSSEDIQRRLKQYLKYEMTNLILNQLVEQDISETNKGPGYWSSIAMKANDIYLDKKYSEELKKIEQKKEKQIELILSNINEDSRKTSMEDELKRMSSILLAYNFDDNLEVKKEGVKPKL